MENRGEIIIYQTADGQTSLEVKMENETVWLSANQMAILFDRDEKTVRKHINNVFAEIERCTTSENGGEFENKNNQ